MSYRGFKNYITWSVANTIETDRVQSDYWNSIADGYEYKYGKRKAIRLLAQAIHRDLQLEHAEDELADAVLHAAIQDVDFEEVAESLLE